MCAGSTLETRYEESANVFMAVIDEEYLDPADKRRPVRSTFTITEKFKGTPPFAAFTTSRRRSDRSDDSCDIALQVGAEYLFFAPDSGAIESCSVFKRDQAERQIAALRSFISGNSADLAEPWHFYGAAESGCRLITTFDIGSPATLVISTSRRQATQAPVTELTIQPGGSIPNGRDRNPRPLLLTVNYVEYSAAWTPARHLYGLAGNDVEALLRELTMSRTLHVRHDANGFGPSFDVEVRTTNLGDAGVKMLDCIRSQRIR
jgi:hypothetical protein